MNGLFVIRVEQHALVLVKNVNHRSLEALDSTMLLVKVHEVRHDLDVLVRAGALVLHPLLDDIAQAGREHQAGYVIVLQSLEKGLAVTAQVSPRALDDRAQVVARDTRVHNHLLRLLPPLDHERQLLLLGHRVVVLDWEVVVEQIVQGLAMLRVNVVAHLQNTERGRTRLAVEGHQADGSIKIAHDLEASLAALPQIAQDEVDPLAVFDSNMLCVQFCYLEFGVQRNKKT